jgi:hypothetical protein
VRCRAGVVFFLVASDLAASAAEARAQGAPDLAAAEALFDEGKRLMEGGRFDEACPKLAVSIRLDVGLGAMLYLAECHVHLGRTASAWGQFREAAALAANRHDAREGLARERAAQLEPHLSRLVVAVSGAGASPVVVRRDGELLDPAIWATPVPVDPGVHTVEASAPGKIPFRAEVTVGADGATSTVAVPPLEDPPSLELHAPAASPPVVEPTERVSPPAPRPPFGVQRAASLGALGLGVAGMILGTYWSLEAKSLLDESNDGHCRGNLCDATGVQARHDAGQDADFATAAFSVGGVALAAGAVLWLTVPRSRAVVTVVPSLGLHQQTLNVSGAF